MKTIKQLAAEKAAQIKADAKAEADKAAKGALPAKDKGADGQGDDNREVISKFFKALASKDPSAMAEAQKTIRAEYAAKAQTINTDSEGGILVPLTVDNNVKVQLEYISPIRQVARVISNAPARLKLPSASGGQAYWVGEGATVSPTAVTFASKELIPEKIASIIPGITMEFLADVASNPSAQTLLENQLATKAALVENEAFVNGDGVDKPFGFRSSAVTPLSLDQAGATLDWTDLVNLQFKLPTAYRNQGIYLLPSAALAKIVGMKDGQGRPIYIPAVSAEAPGTILGRPVVVVDEIPANLGVGLNETEIWYGVFSDYVIGDRLGTTFDLGTSGDDFNKVQYTLRMVKRVGGVPTSNNLAVLRKVL